MLEIHTDSWTKGGRTTVREGGQVVGEMRGTGGWTAEAVVRGWPYRFAPPGQGSGPGLRIALWIGEPPSIVADASHEKAERWEVRSADGRIWSLRSTWRPSKFDVSSGDRSVGRIGLRQHTATCEMSTDEVPMPVQYLLTYLVWCISMRRTEASQDTMPTP